MSAHSRTRRIFVGTLAAALIAGGGAYWQWAPRLIGGDAKAAAPAAPPAVPVTVRTLEPQRVRVWSEFSGRLHAVDSAQIRPEVGGRITEVRFEDGQMVKAGDVLFVIDPRPYDAAVARAKAGLAQAQANASLDFDRSSAHGQRLDIPAGTAVRFEPGIEATVALVPIRGARHVPGLTLDPPGAL